MHNTLTINTKCDILLGMIEKHFKTHEKEMPLMLRGMYKPMMATIRMFLAIMPEQKLNEYLNNAHMVYEAIQCSYTEEKDFREHIDELIAAWI